LSTRFNLLLGTDAPQLIFSSRRMQRSGDRQL